MELPKVPRPLLLLSQHLQILPRAMKGSSGEKGDLPIVKSPEL